MKPNIRQRIRLAVSNLTGTTKNSNYMSMTNAKAFLKYGNGKTQMPNWSQVIMSDQDTYTGIMYGAINIRAVTVAQLATNNLDTEASKSIMDTARKSREEVTHPYLDIIDTSKTFSNVQFWAITSIYLDLEGLMYIMAVRNVSDNGLVGSVQEFKLLNPYNVQRVFDQATGELLGYKEYKGSMQRDIPKEMIIPIINLNPFDDTPYSLTDAVKDHQFTLKTATDYTRNAIANNINAPGIIATDRELEGEELANFKARVMGHDKGEPIFGGGSGSISWQDMQTDLNKSALPDVNTISLQNLVAVTGVSKTMMSWEESGTTRDTSVVQKENFIELRAIPQLQMIIDALNQDYKNYYANEYARTEYTIVIDNPLGEDADTETKESDLRLKDFDLYNSLVNKGYDREIAARYTCGDMTLEELGKPTNEPIMPPNTNPTNPVEKPTEETKQEHDHDHSYLQSVQAGLIDNTQASLQNTIINIDNKLLSEVIKKINVKTNAFNDESDIITKREKHAIQNELELALATFYGIIIPLYAYSILNKRLEETQMTAQFMMNTEVKNFIKDISGKASESHINTLLKGMMEQAQKDAKAGLPRDKIADNILNKFGGEITNSRAVTIARTESHRAFTMSQYQADKQFIKQNDLGGRVYKQFVTHSGNPCDICEALASEAPIPFDEPFASIGDELSATTEKDGETIVKKMSVDFMDIEAGNVHPNCACSYELIIED